MLQMLQNLRTLPLSTWLIAGTVGVIVSLGLWWFHRNFDLDEVEIPFKFKFKRHKKPVSALQLFVFNGIKHLCRFRGYYNLLIGI
jgi:hypothetical protein